MWKNFAGIKFRGWAMLKGFAGIKFRGLALNPQKPRNLVPAKFSTFIVTEYSRYRDWTVLLKKMY